jgi:hypothetical protein
MGTTADKIGTKDLPVDDHGQNKQGNGPEGTPVAEKIVNDMKTHNDKNFDAMNEARTAMGLPPLPKKK